MVAAALAEDCGVAGRMAAHDAATRVVWALTQMRVERGLSQRDLAKRMGTSASKVCRIEAGTDADLRLGDIVTFMGALDHKVTLAFEDQKLPTAERIKHHVHSIHAMLEELRALAVKVGAGDGISEGIKTFYGEVLFNFLLRFGDSYSKLPSSTIRLDGDPAKGADDKPNEAGRPDGCAAGTLR